MTLVTAETAVERCLHVLEQHPSGLFSDFDGTLSIIAPTPDAAQPFAGATEAIGRLALQVDEIGIITGRAAADAQEMIGVPDIRVVGNHGLEMRYRGEHAAHAAGIAASASIERAIAEIAGAMTAQTDVTGMVFENKVYSASIHFRNTASPEAVDEILRPLIVQTAQEHDLRVTTGKMLYEVRPRAVVSKGTALGDLIAQEQLRGAIFLGDDVTDVDGFLTLRELGRDGTVRTLAIGVLSAETPPSVVAESDIVLNGVDEVVHMLGMLADALESGAK